MDLIHALVATSFVEIESNAISFIFEYDLTSYNLSKLIVKAKMA